MSAVKIVLTIGEWRTLRDAIDAFMDIDLDDASMDEDSVLIKIGADKSVELSADYSGRMYNTVTL